MEVEEITIAEPDPSSADSLISSNDPDDLVNEQTWPTEDEMNDVAVLEQDEIPDVVDGTTPKAVRRIPKGMSEYQAAWIIDEDGDEDANEDAKEGEDDMEIAGMQEEEEEMQDMPVEDDHEMDLDNRGRVTFEDLDIEEDEKQ
jgi:pre-rRNA-processing protein TSR1